MLGLGDLATLTPLPSSLHKVHALLPASLRRGLHSIDLAFKRFVQNLAPVLQVKLRVREWHLDHSLRLVMTHLRLLVTLGASHHE